MYLLGEKTITQFNIFNIEKNLIKTMSTVGKQISFTIKAYLFII